MPALISEGGTLLTNINITYSTIAACCQFNRFGCLLITLNIENIKNTKDTCIHILSIEIYIKYTLCCFSYPSLLIQTTNIKNLIHSFHCFHYPFFSFFFFLYWNIGKYRNLNLSPNTGKYRNLSPNTGKYRKW